MNKLLQAAIIVLALCALLLATSCIGVILASKRLKAADRKASFGKLLRMRLRRTLNGDVIGSYLESVDDVGLDVFEAHYVAGGDNKNLVSILNHARVDGFTIAPYRAAALDLAGKRAAEIDFAEERTLQEKEDTPGA